MGITIKLSPSGALQSIIKFDTMKKKMKENSYYYVSYYSDRMLLKEYIHTGAAYRDKYGHRLMRAQEILTLFYNPFTNELECVSWDEELWEPAYYEEFMEITPEEYQDYIDGISFEIETRRRM